MIKYEIINIEIKTEPYTIDPVSQYSHFLIPLYQRDFFGPISKLIICFSLYGPLEWPMGTVSMRAVTYPCNMDSLCQTSGTYAIRKLSF